jgi:hypothetical protein
MSLGTHTPIYDHPNIVVFSVQISYKILPQHFKVFILLVIIKDYAKRAEQFSSSGCFNWEICYEKHADKPSLLFVIVIISRLKQCFVSDINFNGTKLIPLIGIKPVR